MGLLFGFFALFSDVRDQQGRVTRLAIIIGSGIFLSGLLALIVGSMQNRIASSEKEQEIKLILQQIYTENSRLTPEDIELRMDYVCKIEGDEEIGNTAEGAGNIFQMPGWHLTIELQAAGKKGRLTSTATEVLNPRTRYHAGAEHFGDVKARAMRFVDFELGKANEFLYPRTWNDVTISIGFNGTDGSIFATDFIVESESGMNGTDPGADNVKIEYHNRSLCDFDVRGFSEKVKPGENIKYTSNQYLAVLPALFDIELKIKGIVVGNTSGFISQVREVIAFRAGKEETVSFFPMMKTGEDLFPALSTATRLHSSKLSRC
jgi:hypothetical protein